MNSDFLDVQVLHFQRVFLDELAAALDVFAHEHAEHPLGLGGFVEGDAEEDADARVERRLPELLGVHLAQPFEALDLDAVLPDRVDLGRTPNPHLSFGAGIHFCLGAPLGRLELQTSFRMLLERFPRMEPVEEPRWKPSYIVRGLAGLRVRLG